MHIDSVRSPVRYYLYDQQHRSLSQARDLIEALKKKGRFHVREMVEKVNR